MTSLFGHLPTGEAVQRFTLSNANGLEADVMLYGATIVALRVPDRHGRMDDVVLGFDTLEGYLGPHPFFGAIAGRVAGRITGARFSLEGREYPLAVNDPPNHLHGGHTGFNRRFWTPDFRAPDSLRLSYCSPHGEEGYPGTVNASVTYTVTAGNALVMQVEAETDRTTPFSLTQHSYFNLAGEGGGTVEGHDLQVAAETHAPADENMGLLGRREPVTPQNDFNQPRRLGEAIPKLFKMHGDLYFLPRLETQEPRQVARLSEPKSGRVLSVSTTEDCLQIYTGASLDGSIKGKSGHAYPRHAGLCLECEGYPDGVNMPELGEIILRPGKPLRQTTIYTFSTQ